MDSLNKLKSFFTLKRIYILLALIGLSGGSDALRAGEGSVPPLGWTAIGVIFAFCIVGVMFVLGIQLVLKNQKALRLGGMFFLGIGIYNLGSGISALGISIWHQAFGPPSLLFVAIGAGIILGSLVMRSLSPKFPAP